MFNLIGYFLILFSPAPAAPGSPTLVTTQPAPAPMVGTARAATPATVPTATPITPKVPAPVAPTTTTTTTTTVPAAPTVPGTYTGTDCTVTWPAVETNPVTGTTSTYTQSFEGNCTTAASIAVTYPGAVLTTGHTFTYTVSP